MVTDFVFEKDKVFACLNLTDQELETYNRYYNYFREQLPTPDLVIYLQATPEVLKKRLKKKNAPGEKAINEDYLEEVIKAYEHFFFHYTSSDLLIVNTSEIDFVERNQDLQELLRKVSAPIKGTQYFLPLGSQEAASAIAVTVLKKITLFRNSFHPSAGTTVTALLLVSWQRIDRKPLPHLGKLSIGRDQPRTASPWLVRRRRHLRSSGHGSASQRRLWWPVPDRRR